MDTNAVRRAFPRPLRQLRDRDRAVLPFVRLGPCCNLSHMQSPGSSGPEERPKTVKESFVRWKLLLAFSGGIIFFLVNSSLRHTELYRSALDSHRRSSTGHFDPMQFWSKPSLLALAFAWCTYVAISKRREPASLVCAFLSGSSLFFLIFHWLLGWV